MSYLRGGLDQSFAHRLHRRHRRQHCLQRSHTPGGISTAGTLAGLGGAGIITPWRFAFRDIRKKPLLFAFFAFQMIVAAFFLSIHMDRAIGFARDIDQIDMTRITFFRNGEPADVLYKFPEPYDVQYHSEARLRGNPPLWGDLLLPGVSVARLQEAWQDDVVCSEDIIFATAPLVGWDGVFCCIGYNYLDQTEFEPLLHLHFCLAC